MTAAVDGRIDMLIFDMDGVVTTEEKYWACARLTLWELITETFHLIDAFPDAVHDPIAREQVTSDDLIYALKGRSVNSNWDITYILACVYIAALLESADHQPETIVKSIPDLYSAVRARIAAGSHGTIAWPQILIDFIDRSAGNGRDLIEAAGIHLASACADAQISLADDHLIAPDTQLWWDLHARFQRWYSGESLIARHTLPLIDGTVIAPDLLHKTFSILRAQGYTLGVATGRPRDELDDALRELDLLRYFDPARIVTLDVVRRAESTLGVSGLSKPHPYSMLKALYPEGDEAPFLQPIVWAQPRSTAAMIGDSTGDVQMASAASCHAIGVLTGVRGTAAQAIRREVLIRYGGEVILNDLTALPDYLRSIEKV